MNFLSDNTAPAAPQILQALAKANHGPALPYGDDPLTHELQGAFTDYFEHPVRIYPVISGTAANALALAAVTPPDGILYATPIAHVLADECGACELQSGGARLSPVAAQDGRMRPEALGEALAAAPSSVHALRPASISLTQASECGTVYTAEQIASLAHIAHSRDLAVHMDGARFANAIAHLKAAPADVTWRAGVDVLSFGATKNGALGAEAVVFFDPDLADGFERRRKRAAHLLSKQRYLSAQLLACLREPFFADNAARANAMATRIAASAPDLLLHPVEANMLFLRLRPAAAAHLRDAGFAFHPWGAPGRDAYRFVVSWNQPEADIDALCGALRHVVRACD